MKDFFDKNFMDMMTPPYMKKLEIIEEKQDEIINLLKQNNEKIEKLQSEVKKEG